MKKEESNIKIKLDLALKNHKENNILLAEKLYKEVLLFSPNNLSAIFNLATLYAQSKKFNQAKELFLKADNIKPQGIDPSKLVPVLTAALQEAIAKIETLETKVAALEAE